MRDQPKRIPLIGTIAVSARDNAPPNQVLGVLIVETLRLRQRRRKHLCVILAEDWPPQAY